MEGAAQVKVRGQSRTESENLDSVWERMWITGSAVKVKHTQTHTDRIPNSACFGFPPVLRLCCTGTGS